MINLPKKLFTSSFERRSLLAAPVRLIVGQRKKMLTHWRHTILSDKNFVGGESFLLSDESILEKLTMHTFKKLLDIFYSFYILS